MQSESESGPKRTCGSIARSYEGGLSEFILLNPVRHSTTADVTALMRSHDIDSRPPRPRWITRATRKVFPPLTKPLIPIPFMAFIAVGSFRHLLRRGARRKRLKNVQSRHVAPILPWG